MSRCVWPSGAQSNVVYNIFEEALILLLLLLLLLIMMLIIYTTTGNTNNTSAPAPPRPPAPPWRAWSPGSPPDWDYVHELVTQGKCVYEIVSLVPSKCPEVLEAPTPRGP